MRYVYQSTPQHLLHSLQNKWLAGLFCGLLLLTVIPSAFANSARLEFVTRDASGQLLEHVVASLHSKVAAGTPLPTGESSVMDQRNLQFAPSVLAVRKGTTVKFPNDDDVRHHVYSFSHPNAFELKLYHGVPSDNQVFLHEGVVVLGCNIHDGMLGYLRVVDTPYFATSTANGDITIADIPPGDYELQVWHPDLGMKVVRKALTVNPGIRRMEMKVAVDSLDIPPLKAAHPLQSLFRD